jgi:hypothetical protein
MSRRKHTGGRRPPALEISVAARAGEIRYHVPPDVQTRTQGAGIVNDTPRHAGKPRVPERGSRHTDVSASFRIAAWLLHEDDGPAEDRGPRV